MKISSMDQSTERVRFEADEVATEFYEAAVRFQNKNKVPNDPVASSELMLRTLQQEIAALLPKRERAKFNQRCGAFFI